LALRVKKGGNLGACQQVRDAIQKEKRKTSRPDRVKRNQGKKKKLRRGWSWVQKKRWKKGKGLQAGKRFTDQNVETESWMKHGLKASD